MLSNSQAAEPKLAQTAQASSHGLVSQDWAPTVSSGSLFVSLLAFVLSGLALWNTRKTARQTSFDNHYGDSIRAGLRELEDICGRLRAFAFPSKPLDDLKSELAVVQSDIEEKGFQIENLLSEVDAAQLIKCTGWSQEFADQMAEAGSTLESASEDAVTTEIELRIRVESSRDQYRALITNARGKLEQVRKKA